MLKIAGYRRAAPSIPAVITSFAINTGLRLNEILNLKREVVDLENGVVKMLMQKNRRMLEVVKELLGHSTIAVTMRYAHTNRDFRKRHSDSFRKRFKNGKLKRR